jgi:Tfp pilus assembly protein PilE
MDKALINSMIVFIIIFIISIVMTSGNDDIIKAKAEAAAAEAAAAAAAAEAAAAEAAAAAKAEAEADAVEEFDTSLTSFSTSAALSFDDDFIAPDISAGKEAVNCDIGDWEDFGECDQTTGTIKRRRPITPAKYGGQCAVTPDSDGYDYGNPQETRNCDRYCTLDANWNPENPTCPTACGHGPVTKTQTRGQSVRYVPPGEGNTCYDDPNSSERKHVKHCEAIDCPPSSPPSSTHACRPINSNSTLAGQCEYFYNQRDCENPDDNFDIFINFSGATAKNTCRWVDIRPPPSSPSSPPSAPPSASCKARFSPSQDDGIGAGACPHFNQTQCTSNDVLVYGMSKNYFCQWS